MSPAEMQRFDRRKKHVNHQFPINMDINLDINMDINLDSNMDINLDVSNEHVVLDI